MTAAAPRPAACDGGGAACDGGPLPAVAEAEEERRRRRGAQTAVSSSRTARIPPRRRGRGEDGAAAAGPQSYSAAYALVRWIVADLALLATVPGQGPSVLASLTAVQSLASGGLVGSAGRAPSKK